MCVFRHGKNHGKCAATTPSQTVPGKKCEMSEIRQAVRYWIRIYAVIRNLFLNLR